jgi:tetratricopeptide (TPR) repeat protein
VSVKRQDGRKAGRQEVKAFLSAFLPCCLAAFVLCCSARPSVRQDLRPVGLPDLARVDETVQMQARERYARLTSVMKDPNAQSSDLASAYGELGMVLQAAEYFDAAEPCYLNAQTLASAEIRWPYYLAKLHKSRGELDQAEVFFKRVLELQPNDLPTLIWLGRLYLDSGRFDDADALFAKAQTLAPREVSVLAGLGRIALERRDYARAAQLLEEALSIDPEANSLHSQAAMAYRGLGQLDKAQPHVRQWRNRDLYVPDPLGQEIDMLLESGLSYELRGVRAFEARNWKAAADFFRKGLEVTRENTALLRSLHHKLGTALFLSGDLEGAQQEFREVVRLAPAEGRDESAAKANYSLGVISATNGQNRRAIEYFTSAVTYQPNYVEAHLALGDALRRAGRATAALTHYQEAVKINPRSVPGRLGCGITLARLQRYREARDWLDEGTRLYPDQPELAHALARLLVAAPDDRVRDGQRAKAIVQELFKKERSTPLGETMAMTAAELGDFETAAGIQRGVLDAARKAGLRDVVRRMEENLRLYERHQPCRTPWRDDESVHLDAPVRSDVTQLSKPSS